MLMAVEIELTEGWTGPLEFQLLVDDAVPDTDLSGAIELVAHNTRGEEVDTSGDVVISNANEWKVTYTPDITDIIAAHGPYRVRFRVTSGGQSVYFPSGEADKWIIHAQ